MGIGSLAGGHPVDGKDALVVGDVRERPIEERFTITTVS